MQIQLYIRDILADIGDQKEFVRAFKRTLQFSDLDNPTKITTDYTYSCDLPGTDTNRRIFGYIENGTDAYTFNPAAKYGFKLNVNGVLWLTGSVKLDKVTSKSGTLGFSVSFFSTVHDKIVDLGNKKLTDLSGIVANDYYRHYLDCSTMAEFWAGTHQYAGEIRYVPTRAGFYQDFQNDKFMAKGTVGAQVPVATIDVGTEYDEYATKEYRVEYQRPAVSVDFLTKCMIDDNGIEVDASLMSSPIIHDSWMMNPLFNVEAQESDIYGTIPNNSGSSVQQGSSVSWAQGGMTQTTPHESTVFNDVHITPESNCRYVTVECAIRVSMRLEDDRDGAAMYVETSGDENAHRPTINAVLYNTGSDQVTNILPLTKLRMKSFLGHDWISGDMYLGYPWYVQGSGDAGDWCIYWNKELSNTYPGYEDKYWTPVKFSFPLSPGVQTGHNYSLQFTLSDITYAYNTTSGYNSWIMGGTHGTFDRIKIDVIPIESLNAADLNRVKAAGFAGRTLYYAASAESWSPLYANMNYILDSSMSQRQFLTDITKMTGCVWDLSNNGVSIKTRNNFFNGYKVKDWSSKLDRSSGIEITPLTYDKATYTLSYKDGDSFLEHQFKDKMGMDYGKQYIQTGYAFNNDTESLFECTAYNTVMSKGDRMCITFINKSPKMQTQTPYELPMIETNDHGSPKEGPRFVFDCGVTYLEKGEYVYITHDSPYMRTDDIGGRCWMDVAGNSADVAACRCTLNAIPKFSTRLGMATFDWAKPRISYCGENDNTYPENISLYERFWSNYLGSLYSAETRVMTASFNLSVMDLLNFSFRDFVSIDNRLWHPNKIIDFDISGESLTKVELVEVNDIDAWVNGQNWDFALNRGEYNNYVDPSSMVIYPPTQENEDENS